MFSVFADGANVLNSLEESLMITMVILICMISTLLVYFCTINNDIHSIVPREVYLKKFGSAETTQKMITVIASRSTSQS